MILNHYIRISYDVVNGNVTNVGYVFSHNTIKFMAAYYVRSQFYVLIHMP